MSGKRAHVHWSAARNEERPSSRGVNAIKRSFRASIGLHRISLVRASEETLRTGVFDALEVTRVACLLGEPIRRRPVLPGPASPCRPAVRCLDSAPCSMFGFWIRQVPNLLPEDYQSSSAPQSFLPGDYQASSAPKFSPIKLKQTSTFQIFIEEIKQNQKMKPTALKRQRQ